MNLPCLNKVIELNIALYRLISPIVALCCLTCPYVDINIAQCRPELPNIALYRLISPLYVALCCLCPYIAQCRPELPNVAQNRLRSHNVWSIFLQKFIRSPCVACFILNVELHCSLIHNIRYQVSVPCQFKTVPA